MPILDLWSPQDNVVFTFTAEEKSTWQFSRLSNFHRDNGKDGDSSWEMWRDQQKKGPQPANMGKIMYSMWVYHGIATVNDFLLRIWEAGLGGLCCLCGRQDCFVLRQASEGSTTSAVSQAAKPHSVSNKYTLPLHDIHHWFYGFLW